MPYIVVSRQSAGQKLHLRSDFIASEEDAQSLARTITREEDVITWVFKVSRNRLPVDER